MRSLNPSRLFGSLAEAPKRLLPSATESFLEPKGILATVGWVSAGLGTVAVGLILGRELRRRYKFRRRTPYDFYAHSGDERDLEFGVGI